MRRSSVAPQQKSYLCIDLKSFYASAECIARGLDPFTTNLVVADPRRTDKTICLAVSPAMKKLGVPGRCRVFEIPQGIDYIMAPPRMRYYMEKSAEIYGIYLRKIAPEDIFVYSIDEAFFDVTPYLSLYGMSARELGESLRSEVAKETGITATCGLGTNLYLAKVALDISAKHRDDFFGELDEESYCKTLWRHRPITDFWRVGPGIARRLDTMGIHTMGQLAHAPTEPLFCEFGKDAEILIDHAWGIEPCTMADIKSYQRKAHSLSSNQVFGSAYDFEDALLVVKEMADQLALRLTEGHLVAGGISLYAGYEMTEEERDGFRGTKVHRYQGPSGSGSQSFLVPTSSSRRLRQTAEAIFRERCDPTRRIKRLGLGAFDVVDAEEKGMQLSLFAEEEDDTEERSRQETLNEIKHRFGKNAILKGMDLLPKATTRERNAQIGGHRSGEEDDGAQDVRRG